MRITPIAVAASLVLLTGTVFAEVAPAKSAPSADDPALRPRRFTVELTTLRLLLAKGIITRAELDSAMRDLVDSTGDAGGDSLTLVLGRWSTTLYGFIEADNIWDSTESFGELAGNAVIARGTTYAGQNGRFLMSVRNSRLGFLLRAPEYHGVRASAMLEMDFLGNQPPIGYSSTAGAFQIGEGAYFTNPAFRARHLNIKIETPIVDVLVGQYWQLFGWQSVYHPNSVEIQGLPGQIYSRTPQLRVWKRIKTRPVTVEVAAAMMRAPQRDSWTPEGQAGARLAVNAWTGIATAGAAGTSVQPLSVAVTGDVRQLNLPPFAGKTTPTVGKTGWGVAVDAFVPLLPARGKRRSNALSLNGELGYGYGIADLYTNLSGGAGNAQLPAAMPGGMPTNFSPNADPALVDFAADGSAHLIQWQSGLVGAQYYFPGGGNVWVSANYSHMSSKNARLHPPNSGTGAPVTDSDFADGNLFWDATPALRVGLEYAWFRQQLSDATFAVDHRVQLSAFYLF